MVMMEDEEGPVREFQDSLGTGYLHFGINPLNASERRFHERMHQKNNTGRYI